VTTLFQSLDRLETEMQKSSTPYLLSSPHVTEADIRLFTTIIRFDPVYVQHFKCNIRDMYVLFLSPFPFSHLPSISCTCPHHLQTHILTLCRRSGYPALHKWLRHLYWDYPAFGSTTEFEHIKKHYTRSHGQINKFQITPIGPLPDILEKEDEVRSVRAVLEK
jgi:putative glutathione S-transferase